MTRLDTVEQAVELRGLQHLPAREAEADGLHDLA